MPTTCTGTPISLSTTGSGTAGDPYVFTVGGNGTSLKNAQSFGAEIANRLLAAHVNGVILTST